MTQVGFTPTWQDPSDDERTWRRIGGPYPVLYHDVERVLRQHYEVCWSLCAPPMIREYELRIMDGWFFVSGPPFGDEAVAKLRQHAASVPDPVAYYEDTLKPEVTELVTRLQKHPRPTRPLPELVAHLEECLDAYGHVMGDLHWRMAASMMGRMDMRKPGYTWPPTYAEITGRPESEAMVLVGGLANEMTKCVREVQKVARVVRSDPALGKAVEAGDLDAANEHPVFRSSFRSLLRKFGHRTGSGWGSNTKLGDPTWNVEPSIPLSMISSYAKADLDALAQKERDVAKARKALERTVRRSLKRDPEQLASFEKEFEIAQRHAWLMEDHNDWMDQSTPGLVRDAAHMVGLHLVRKKKLDDPTDVLHLTLAELKDLPSDARALVAQRKALLDEQSRMEPPEYVGAPPEEGQGMPDMSDAGDGQKGNVLHGIAASSGTYTGRARVFMPSPIPPDLDDGDILVAVDAGPDWTPLFAICGAVVLDKGAAWQHAGVVAREYGIPAVTGTKTGTEAITDGSTITVDGDAGTVQLGA